MTPATVLDTGPLVALLNRNDAHYSRCVDLFASLTGTPLVTATVMIEVCWLLVDAGRLTVSPAGRQVFPERPRPQP